MKYYELTYLASPEISDENLSALKEKVAAFVQKKGEILGEVRPPAKRILGYPIKKRKSAFLATFNFSAPPDLVNDLKKMLDEEREILRYLIIIKREPAKAEAPPIPEKFKKEIKKPTVPTRPKEKKVELEEIEKKLEEILGKS